MSGIGGPYAATSGVNYLGAPTARSAAGSHTYVITATDKAGNTSTYNGTFTIAAARFSRPTPGPTISSVAVSLAKGKISWNAADSDGVASATLSIDGANVSGIGGPYSASSGVNFSSSYGSLGAGNHAYVIAATDKAGNTSTYNGTFAIAAAPVQPTNTGPTIGSVVVSQAKGKISWNAADSDGVGSVSLTIDGANVSGIGGPYAATSGANYSGPYGSLASGNHSYVITATDKLGNASTYNGTFTIGASTTTTGPAISSIVVSMAKSKLTWNAADSNGVSNVALMIDGANVSSINGPYAASSGANYSWGFGSLGTGNHNYVIRATDNAGSVSTSTGSFTTGSSNAASSAMFSGAAMSALSNSAKVDWLYDLGGLTDGGQSGSQDKDASAAAVDAVMAAA